MNCPFLPSISHRLLVGLTDRGDEWVWDGEGAGWVIQRLFPQSKSISIYKWRKGGHLISISQQKVAPETDWLIFGTGFSRGLQQI